MKIRYDLKELSFVAEQFIKDIGDNTVFAFYGEMGAGKTTLIAEVCRQLGVSEPVNSPTFAIVNEYDSDYGTVYHFDCYRLKSYEEGFGIGVEDYFNSGNLCFIEWAENIENILPEDTVRINIGVLSNTERVLEIRERDV